MSLSYNINRMRDICALLDQDDPDKIDMLDTEADYTKLIEWAVEKRNYWLSQAQGCKELAETYTSRRKSFESAADSLKDVIFSIMSAAGEVKYKGVSGTVSIRDVPPKPEVREESLLPEKYWKISKSVDKAKINADIKDGKKIPGVGMDNGNVTISIRTK